MLVALRRRWLFGALEQQIAADLPSKIWSKSAQRLSLIA
jgi:hypothetical protein